MAIICIERQKNSSNVADYNLIIGKQLNDYCGWRQSAADHIDCLQQNLDVIILNE